METALPQSEQLHFDIPSNVPEELSDLVLHISKVAEELLYHWKSFPIVLPPSVTAAGVEENGENSKGIVDFSRLFITPSFDELAELASNSKQLSDKQLESIRNIGEFDVPSLHFPGQVHKWRLSLLLQKGAERCRQTFLGDLAVSLRLLIITARDRITSPRFSLRNSLTGLRIGFWHILDLLVGMPAVTAGDLSKKLSDEHAKHLVAELGVKSADKQDWLLFCDSVKERCQMLEYERQKTTVRPPPVPYTFISPKGTEIDLRLLNKDLMSKCLELLRQILDREARGWHVRFKNHLIAELKSENLSNAEIAQRVNTATAEEYRRRVYDAVLQSDDIEALHHKLGMLLVQQSKANLIVARAVDSVRQNYATLLEEHRQLLVRTYPVKSKIDGWMNDQLNSFQEDFQRQNQWRAHEIAIEHCRDEKLEQMAYLLHRDLNFKRDREHVLRDELGRVRTPIGKFTFSVQTWLPRNWVVTRHFNNESEVIPTVIVKQFAQKVSRNMNTPHYTVKRDTCYHSSTRFVGWRWLNYLLRTWSWLWNAMFLFGVVIPWCSPVGLRALFCRDAFYPDYEVNQTNGTLCPKDTSRTPTMRSKLSQLWAHVRRSREDFEEAPDTGFLGKSMTRQLNRVWNYVLKGAMGTIFLVTMYPTACCLTTLVSAVAAITAPIWIPVATLMAQLVVMFLYDFDHPHGRMFFYIFEAVFGRILAQGCVQPVCALVTAVVLCPIASAAVVAFGGVRWSLRTLWDKLMFVIVIKRRARVPATDSFVARRIAGPGLASNYFYQILPQQALAAVEAQIELHELKAWQVAEETKVAQPRKAFERFVTLCFEPFSSQVANRGVYENVLLREEHDILHSLHEQLSKRRRLLDIGLSSNTKEKIKINKRELKVIMTQTAKLLERLYPSRVLSHMTLTTDEFWESKMLEANDWLGLATQFLTEVFSSNFLTPLEDTDTSFSLQVEHVDLSKYAHMLHSADFHDDLSVVSTVLTEQADIDLSRPSMDLSVFTPAYVPPYPAISQKALARVWHSASGRRQGQGQWTCQLTSALPLLHPSTIALLIYNRENDLDSISVADSACQHVLKVAEGMTCVERRYSLLCPGTDYDNGTATPDQATTVSDANASMTTSIVGGVSYPCHLAQQEQMLSDDSLPVSLPISKTGSVLEGQGQGDVANVDLDDVETRLNEIARMSVSVAEQMRIIYQEEETDNSCVLDIGDGDK